MRISDLLKLSQTNLVRSKLRTFLTVLAVFIGAFTISLTNGVGNGIRSYVDRELGNLGSENMLQVQAKQPQFNPVATNVTEYDPNKTTGTFNFALLSNADLENMRNIRGVLKVIPQYNIQIAYVQAANGKKYEATGSQFIEGLNLSLVAGRTVAVDSDNEVTIPARYVKPLGFGSSNAALEQTLVVGYKDSSGKIVERTFKIVGVQEQTLLGNTALYLSPRQTASIQTDQTLGIASQQNVYQALLVTFDKNMSSDELTELKQLFSANGYTAATLQDQIGTISKVIDAMLVILNIFGGIALLAATFGIVNTLLMAVKERTSEIGLMKALGTNSRTIFSIFSLEAASIGFWGGLLGIFASIGAGSIINNVASKNFLKDFTGFDLLAFPIGPSILILAGIVLLSFAAGTLPSLKASRLDPIKALRYE